MLRLFALLGIALLSGCQTPREVVVGRANGRDLIVSETEIQKRINDRGVSRAVALRELRRESEMRAALEMQKEWKSRNDVIVEGVKARTRTDQPEAPNEDEVFEHISHEQSKRANARAALFEESEEAEAGSLEEKQNDVADRLRLPSKKPEFDEPASKEGWNRLTGEAEFPREGGSERLGKNKRKTQLPISTSPTE